MKKCPFTHSIFSSCELFTGFHFFSFGQTALFMVGGITPDEVPEAVFLESGDIVLMTGNSRLRYHGVPKIMRARSQPWNMTETENVGLDSKNGTSKAKDTPYDDENCVNMERIRDQEFWQPFNQYISEARINLNVRQVM